MNGSGIIGSRNVLATRVPMLASQADLIPSGDAGVFVDELDSVCNIPSHPWLLPPPQKCSPDLPLMNILLAFPFGSLVNVSLNGMAIPHGIGGHIRTSASVRIVRRNGFSMWNWLLNSTEFTLSCAVDSLEGFALYTKTEVTFGKTPRPGVLITFEYGSALIDLFHCKRHPIARIIQLGGQFCTIKLLGALRHLVFKGEETVTLEVAQLCLSDIGAFVFRFDYDGFAANLAMPRHRSWSKQISVSTPTLRQQLKLTMAIAITSFVALLVFAAFATSLLPADFFKAMLPSTILSTLTQVLQSHQTIWATTTTPKQSSMVYPANLPPSLRF